MITSLSNPLVKLARSLRQSKGRAATGMFLVEGIHPVGEAVSAGWEIEAILYTTDSLRSEFVGDLVSRFPGRIEEVAARTLASVAGKENPQGILAIVHERTRGLKDLANINQAAALVSAQDPGNVGSVLRTLDAIGGHALFLLDGGVEPFHPTAVRASMGALFWIPIVKASFEEFQDWRRSLGFELIGTSARGGLDFREFAPRWPWALLLGSEQKGLTADQKRGCDVILSVEMKGRATSLNLAVAAGVLLYGLCAGSRQDRAAAVPIGRS